MSKAILVLDMPDSCRECPLGLSKHQCAVNAETMIDNTIRQTWCPLKEIPDKQSGSECFDEFEDGYAHGWNSCIEEITD